MEKQQRRPILKVIDGGGNKPPSWKEVPSLVLGRSPLNHDEITSFRVATHDIQKALDNHRRQPLLDLWACVVGELPSFPNVSQFAQIFSDNRSSLSQAYACFQGLKRPLGDDDNGYDVFAFVTKPTITFTYKPDLNCMIRPKQVPLDLVHVAYVKLDRVRGSKNGSSELAATGTLLHWEFVEADASDNSLPTGFAERYRRRRW